MYICYTCIYVNYIYTHIFLRWFSVIVHMYMCLGLSFLDWVAFQRACPWKRLARLNSVVIDCLEWWWRTLFLNTFTFGFEAQHIHFQDTFRCSVLSYSCLRMLFSSAQSQRVILCLCVFKILFFFFNEDTKYMLLDLHRTITFHFLLSLRNWWVPVSVESMGGRWIGLEFKPWLWSPDLSSWPNIQLWFLLYR